eukprot:1142311-Pelagomonas_calceolata.AAC.4
MLPRRASQNLNFSKTGPKSHEACHAYSLKHWNGSYKRVQEEEEPFQAPVELHASVQAPQTLAPPLPSSPQAAEAAGAAAAAAAPGAATPGKA